jgi:hypothetical protein
MRNVFKNFVVTSFVVLFLLSGCNFGAQAPSDTVEVVEVAAPADTPVPAVEVVSQPAAGIEHTDIPAGLPDQSSGKAGDFDSSTVLDANSLIGGDRFTYNRFERPFNSDTMDVYFSQIDIVNTEVFQDEMWIYARISLKDLGASSSQTAKYAVELDTTLNGKANWLVIVDKPESTDWTVNGVRLYQDANGNVGGEFPALTDKNPVSGDGFEALIFDQGEGPDPDTAWARISLNDSNVIEIAVKRAAIGNPSKYLINMWAGHDMLDPARFDLNDNFTHEQAGAADKGLEYYYPIKEVSEIDNSCRIAIGFQPTGLEPGLCQLFIPQQIKDPASPQGCQASGTQIMACTLNSDPSYACSWNSSSCSCDCVYVGPN